MIIDVYWIVNDDRGWHLFIGSDTCLCTEYWVYLMRWLIGWLELIWTGQNDEYLNKMKWHWNVKLRCNDSYEITLLTTSKSKFQLSKQGSMAETDLRKRLDHLEGVLRDCNSEIHVDGLLVSMHAAVDFLHFSYIPCRFFLQIYHCFRIGGVSDGICVPLIL